MACDDPVPSWSVMALSRTTTASMRACDLYGRAGAADFHDYPALLATEERVIAVLGVPYGFPAGEANWFLPVSTRRAAAIACGNAFPALVANLLCLSNTVSSDSPRA